jgi:hypothetical protein
MTENVNINPDPLAKVHDDDLRQLIDRLDLVRAGLSDMQASPVLDSAPELQAELCNYARVIRAAADLFFFLREAGHR